jgi:hypothetical protein
VPTNERKKEMKKYSFEDVVYWLNQEFPHLMTSEALARVDLTIDLKEEVRKLVIYLAGRSI